MAKINIEYDTKGKSLSVMMNGQEMKNLTDFSFGKYEKEWHCSFGAEEYDEENDCRTRHYMYASKEDAEKLIKDGKAKQSKFEDFVEKLNDTKDSIKAYIEKYLKR